MSDFLKIWLNAVAASISAFAGLPYEPVVRTRGASTRKSDRQMSFPFADSDDGYRQSSGYPGHAHPA